MTCRKRERKRGQEGREWGSGGEGERGKERERGGGTYLYTCILIYILYILEMFYIYQLELGRKQNFVNLDLQKIVFSSNFCQTFDKFLLSHFCKIYFCKRNFFLNMEEKILGGNSSFMGLYMLELFTGCEWDRGLLTDPPGIGQHSSLLAPPVQKIGKNFKQF